MEEKKDIERQSDNKKENEIKLNLLSEVPVEEDRFGVHERVADLIYRIIEKITEKDKCKKKNTIGLFGTWGAGKSSVINILKYKYKEKLEVLVFDSWAYKDDLLRKTFLVQVAKFLNLESKLVSEVFEKRKKGNSEPTVKEYLTKRIIEQKVDKHPKIDITLPLYIILVLLVFSLLTQIFQVYLPQNKELVFLSIFLFLSVIGWFAKERLHLKEIFSPFLGGYFDVTENSVTAESKDVTTEQFQELFSNLIDRWIKDKVDNNKKLVIVLDNLDRVTNETVLKFISLLQLVTEALMHDEREYLCERVIFIVPIDKKRLLDILGSIMLSKGVVGDEESLESDGSNSTGNTSNIQEIDSRNSRENFAEDFIEKIFPYTVTLPELVPRGWKKFFAEKFMEAFENNKIGDFDIELIMRLFQRGLEVSKDKLTPREIINFINQMVTHCIYWYEGNKINGRFLINLAAFVSIERYESKFLENMDNLLNLSNVLGSSEVIKRSIKPYLDSGYLDLNAMVEDFLRFKFKTKYVGEILYGNRLENALVDGSLESVQTIYKQLNDEYAFSRLVLTVLHDNIKVLSMDIRRLGNCSYALKSYIEESQYKESILKELESAMKNFVSGDDGKASTLDANSTKGVVYMLKNISKETTKRDLFEKIVNVLIATELEEENE